MKVLIVGGCGFIGSYISKNFCQNGINVYVTYRNEIKNKINDVTYINVKNIEELLKNNFINVVINLATDYGRVNPLSKVVETNVKLPIELAELCIKYNVEKFITTDSFFSKHGKNYSYLKGYIESKSTCSRFLRYLGDECVIINMNLSHVYGANDDPYKFFPSLLRDLTSNKKNLQFTKGEQIRDFIHVKDVARTYLLVLDGKFEKGFHNIDICSDEKKSIKEFIEESYKLLKEYGYISGVEKELNFGAIEYREGEIMNVEMDSYLIRCLGWSPKYNLKTGISESILNEFTK